MRVTTDVLVLDIDAQGRHAGARRAAGYPVVKGEAAAGGAVQHATAPPLTTCCRPASRQSRRSNAARRTWRRSQRPPTATRSRRARTSCACRSPGPTARASRSPRPSSSSAACSPSASSTRSTTVGTAPWVLRSYARIVRTDPPVERSMFKVESFAFRGPAYLRRRQSYQQAQHREDATTRRCPTSVDERLDRRHAASLRQRGRPGPTKHRTTSRCGVNGREYMLGVAGPGCRRWRPAPRRSFKENLFVGPKLQKQLETLHRNSSRVADYGMLTLLSQAAVLAARSCALASCGNWGLAIILVTFLLKLAVLSAVGESRPLDGEDARARAAHEDAAGNLQGRPRASSARR